MMYLLPRVDLLIGPMTSMWSRSNSLDEGIGCNRPGLRCLGVLWCWQTAGFDIFVYVALHSFPEVTYQLVLGLFSP